MGTHKANEAAQSTGERPDQRLPRRARLQRASDFAEAYQQNERYFGPSMVMYVRRAPDAALRIGVVAGRKIGGAVERNRARRRLKEVFRQERARLKPGVDIVLIARACPSAPTFDELRREFLNLAARAGLLKENASCDL